jgi:hypothetical protein
LVRLSSRAATFRVSVSTSFVSLGCAGGGTSGGLGKLGRMDAREKILTGGRITQGVVRIVNTVRRPTGPHTPFVHSLMRHLEEGGFDGAPRVLGIDEKRREILTFIEGNVPQDLATWSDEQLVRAAELIRRFHDATAGSALAGEEEVVCHNDLSPCNTVFVKGMPSAFIDFDEAAPGSRSEDLGYASWLFLDLGAEDIDIYTQGRRIRMMCDAYGLDDRFDAIGAIAQSQQATLERSLSRLRSGGSQSTVAYARDSVRWIREEIAWLGAHWNELEAAMG